MADISDTAPASAAEINAAQAGPKDAGTYPLRKAIAEWLADDKDGPKAAWLKASNPQ